MNSVAIIGRLTKDPQVKYIGKDNTAIAEFTIAVPGIKKDDTDFIGCKAFGKTAEIIEKYAGKGKQVGIEGRIKTEKWEKDGKQESRTKVYADRIDLLGSKSEDDIPAKMPEGFEKITDEEIPF